jgi:hypothetical protein
MRPEEEPKVPVQKTFLKESDSGLTFGLEDDRGEADRIPKPGTPEWYRKREETEELDKGLEWWQK